MIDKTQRLNESLDSFLTEYKEKNEGNKYRPVAVGRYGIRTRESIYSKELAKDYSKNKLIFKNTLTVGMGSTQIDIGVLSEDATYAVSPAYHTYRIHDINSDYLRYCLECRNQDMFVRYVKRGSRQGKSIDLKRWITYKIPVYPESVQAEIVKRLDSVKAILSLREQELNALDDLIKARFVEMFGHQSHNEKGLPYLTIDDVAEIYLGITHTPTYVNQGVMFISAKNTSGDFLDLSDVKYISREEFEKAPKGSKPQVNDILFSRVGSNLGHPVILEEDLELCTFVSLGFLRTKGKVTSNYLKHWMRDDFFSNQVKEHVKGGGQPNLNTGWLKEFKIIVPNIELQKVFDKFCRQVDKSKAAVQKALDETQLLFDSLMQEYFG